jgi:hypothetical protein
MGCMMQDDMADQWHRRGWKLQTELYDDQTQYRMEISSHSSDRAFAVRCWLETPGQVSPKEMQSCDASLQEIVARNYNP